MKQPAVSVVIPMHNRAHSIIAAVDSVLAQVPPVAEVIVVDDHSDDEGPQRVRSHADARVRLLRNNRSRGAQGARNTGVLAAQGPWIAFHDSDDLWLTGKLERQLKALADRNFDPLTVVHGDAWVQRSGQTRRLRFHPPRTQGRALDQLLLRPAPLLQSLIVHRDLLLRIDLLDEQVPAYQEWDLSIRLAHHAHFVHLRTPLFLYFTGGSDAISADPERDLRGYEYIVAQHRELILAHHGEAGLAWHHRFLHHRAARLGLPSAARRYRQDLLGRWPRPALDRALLAAAEGRGKYARVAFLVGAAWDALRIRWHRATRTHRA